VYALYFILDEGGGLAGKHATESKRQHFLNVNKEIPFNFLAEPVGASPYNPIIFNNRLLGSASSPVDPLLVGVNPHNP